MGEKWGAPTALGPGYSAFWVPVFGFRIERREGTKGGGLLRSATTAHLIHIVLAVGLRVGVGATTVQLPSLANRERSLIALLLDVDAPAGEACLLLDTCELNELHVENCQPGVPLRAQQNAVCGRIWARTLSSKLWLVVAVGARAAVLAQAPDALPASRGAFRARVRARGRRDRVAGGGRREEASQPQHVARDNPRQDSEAPVGSNRVAPPSPRGFVVRGLP